MGRLWVVDDVGDILGVDFVDVGGVAGIGVVDDVVGGGVVRAFSSHIFLPLATISAEK